MSEEVDKVVRDAASNVACESGNLSEEELKKIKSHLMGLSNQSDDSFIYGLVKTLKDEKNGRKSK